MKSMDRPLRILAVVNVPWDPRLGAARVWIELIEEWRLAGHHVEKFCFTDAFPDSPGKPVSPAGAVIRLLFFPFRAARFIRANADRFDVIDALIGAVPFSKKSLGFRGLLVARSVGLFSLYEKFSRVAAKRWAPATKGKLLGRPFHWFFNRRVRTTSQMSMRHCDLLNLPNVDEADAVRDEMCSAKPVMVQPYGLRPVCRQTLFDAAASAEVRWRKKKIVFIGMWNVRKGAKDWGQIIREIRARVPEACFLFLGTMIANDTFWNDLGMAPCDYIEIVPHFNPDELPRLLSECTVGAFPSYVEGFGLAVVEQLAAGLPTVAYDAPGPRDILGKGFPEALVPAGDISRFSEAISKIITSDLTVYRDLSCRSVEIARRFSWPEIARATIAEYRKYLENAGA
jgi:glycosyltransferase involved in cell wall biosynthesis